MYREKMTYNKIVNGIKSRKHPNDEIYTPNPLALKLIEMCDLKEGDKVLDPCYGGGVFYENLPDYVEKDWCEIEKGKDFFDYKEKVDWIIGNPPFSLWNKWLDHTMTLTDKFAFVMNTNNLTHTRLQRINDNGYGLVKMDLCDVRWWMGRVFLVVFEKNKPSIITCNGVSYKCDICNKSNCKRGRKGYSYNTCTNVIN
jgi:hypothetical protein